MSKKDSRGSNNNFSVLSERKLKLEQWLSTEEQSVEPNEKKIQNYKIRLKQCEKGLSLFPRNLPYYENPTGFTLCFNVEDKDIKYRISNFEKAGNKVWSREGGRKYSKK